MTRHDSMPDSFGEKLFRDVADSWAMPMMILNKDLRFAYANDAYMTATETDWERLAGQYIFDIFPDVRGRQEPVEAKFREVFSGKRTTLEAQPYELIMPDGTVETRVWQAVQDPHYDEDGNVTHMIQRAEDITTQVELKRQNDYMENELAHRIRNMFAVIMATSRISGESADDVGTYVKDFNERLASMSRTYFELSRRNWCGLRLRDILESELIAIVGRNASRFTLDGPDFLLTVKASKDAAMIAHELAANARKFGCFSVPGGHLHLSWKLEDNFLVSVWKETGVGPVQPPVRTGFGTQIFKMFPRTRIEREYTDDGLIVTIHAQLLPSSYEDAANEFAEPFQ